jgi:dihydroorotate dehydrogenase electron transfer subunit
MRDENCTVIENIHINKKYFLMKVKAEYISKNSQPGNFVMVAVSNTTEPLLKRPFGIFKSEYPYIWIYFEVVGKGTELLSTFREKDPIHIIGPLGNSFPEFQGKNLLLIAGGRGIAPIYYAIKGYTLSNKVSLIYGARSKEDLNLLDHISAQSLDCSYLYTDDGSTGKKGYVSDDLKEIIKKNKIHVTISCGPEAMFHSLAKELKGIPTENHVSLESLMGCGFGICYSCAVKTTKNKYKKVCSDGPIFRMEEIEW